MKHFISTASGEQRQPQRAGLKAGFSLVEIMIAVTLMSVIVLGLMAMFTQTQRAFRLGMSQTDVLESGRVATDMMVRELEQTSPTYRGGVTNFSAEYAYADYTQKMPGVQPPPSVTGQGFRANVMHDLFFMVRENQTWTGIGYFVRTDLTPASHPVGPVGTLYRFEATDTVAQMANNPSGMVNEFNLARNGNNSSRVSKIMEGVVNLRIRAYETNSYWIDRNIVQTSPVSTNISGIYDPVSGEASVRFYSNAIPASVELEIGVLEQQTYERYKAMPPGAVKDGYFNEHAGNVHLFRQRVRFRNVDVTAYQ